MRRTIILSLCLLLGTQLAFGQEKTREKKTPEQRAEMMTDRLDETVKLSTDQRKKIYDINLRSAEKMSKIRKDEGMTDDQRHDKLKEHRMAVKKQVMNELTADQKKILEEKKKEFKAEHKKHKKGSGDHAKTPEQRAEKMTAHLDETVKLSAEQKSKIQELNLRSAQKMEEIRKDTKLTDEQRKEAMKKNHMDTKKQVMAQLTDEQKKILKEKRKEMKNR